MGGGASKPSPQPTNSDSVPPVPLVPPPSSHQPTIEDSASSPPTDYDPSRRVDGKHPLPPPPQSGSCCISGSRMLFASQLFLFCCYCFWFSVSLHLFFSLILVGLNHISAESINNIVFTRHVRQSHRFRIHSFLLPFFPPSHPLGSQSQILFIFLLSNRFYL